MRIAMLKRVPAVALTILFLINVIALVPVPCSGFISQHAHDGVPVAGTGRSVDGPPGHEEGVCPMHEDPSCKAGRVSCRGCFLMVFNTCTHDEAPAERHHLRLVTEMSYIHSSPVLMTSLRETSFVPAEMILREDFHPPVDDKPPADPA